MKRKSLIAKCFKILKINSKIILNTANKRITRKGKRGKNIYRKTWFMSEDIVLSSDAEPTSYSMVTNRQHLLASALGSARGPVFCCSCIGVSVVLVLETVQGR